MTERTEIGHLLSRQPESQGDVGTPSKEANVRHRNAMPATSRRAAELLPGDVLEGRYALLSPLGVGGMGDVWLAHNTMLDVHVALKVLRVDENQPERRMNLTQRLLQEARAAAKLDHPAIVRITDFGQTPAGNGFFVMELLEGEDLHALLGRHGRLSATKSVRTLLPVAGALVAAHAKGIVHRDLKPENIFLAHNKEQGTVQPKLIDFGVAKLKVANERITIAGTVMGSPGYMAPEQARGEDVDERADICGTPLAATWIRERSEASLLSASAPDPFVSGSIPGAIVSEARPARAELATEPPPAWSRAPSTSLSPPTEASFVRSRALAIAAIALGAVGGIVFGGWALGRANEATPAAAAAETAVAVSFQVPRSPVDRTSLRCFLPRRCLRRPRPPRAEPHSLRPSRPS